MLLYYRMKDEFKQGDNTNEEKKIARNTLMWNIETSATFLE